MKRDMDLVRDILRQVEEEPYTMNPVKLTFADRPENEIAYHVLLLDEAGLLEAMDFSSMDGPAWKPVRLTWEGHEFLEASRDDTRWEKAKAMMQEKAGGMSFEVIKALLISLMKNAVV